MCRISSIGENKLCELMDNGGLEYIQNGNRRLIAAAAIWDWYQMAKITAKPSAAQHEAEMKTKLQNPGQIASITSQSKQTPAMVGMKKELDL